MSENNKISRDELVDMEKTNSNLKEKYERQIKEMFERKNNKPVRIVFALSGLLGLLITIGLSTWIFCYSYRRHCYNLDNNISFRVSYEIEVFRNCISSC